eukprot:Pgem_evm2s8906
MSSTKCKGGCGKSPTRCKLPDMIDVKSAKCIGGCGRHPSCNYPGIISFEIILLCLTILNS